MEGLKRREGVGREQLGVHLVQVGTEPGEGRGGEGGSTQEERDMNTTKISMDGAIKSEGGSTDTQLVCTCT